MRTFPSACYRALTLSERLRLAPATGFPTTSERGRTRLEQWRTQFPLQTDDWFQKRLTHSGIDEARLQHLLDEDDVALQQRCSLSLPWFDAFAADIASDTSEPFAIHASTQGFAWAPALRVLQPFISRGKERLRHQALVIQGTYPHAPFDVATIVDTMYGCLAPALVSMIARTMALEINAARLLGTLQGDTPEDRFNNFFTHMSQPDARAELFQEYPVLARRVIECIEAWVKTSAEFLTRLCSDWLELRTTLFGNADPGLMVNVEGSMGDTHRGGRSVRIVRFGSGQKIVYKPRSLAIDARFQSLLAWLNAQGQQPQFKTLALLSRKDYGWTEFVSAAPCKSHDEIRRFYERQGGYLALLYALNAADFHHENLIASGEHPMLIDLEALLHPHFTLAGAPASLAAANAVIDESVLRTGLLPFRSAGRGDAPGLDISGLGGAAGQLTPFNVAYWKQRGTDEIQLDYGRVEVPAADNKPTLHGNDVDLLEFSDALVSGFDHTYRLLQTQRSSLLAADGPISQLMQEEIRVIFRPTARYDELLMLGYHPDMLRDGLDRERFFDRLWLGVDKVPELTLLIDAERDDMLRGDIPLFTTRANSRDVWTASGECIANVLKESSATHVERCLLRLGDRDLALQKHLIQASLATLNVGRDAVPVHMSPLLAPKEGVENPFLQKDLVAGACAVADALESMAIGSGDERAWIGMVLVADSYWSLAPLGTDLFTGLPGVALFFGALGKITNERRYRDLARAALRTLFAQVVADGGERLINIGAFSGWGGLIYSLSQLGSLLDDPDLIATAADYVRRVPRLIEQDTGLDLINGSAGCIMGLLSLHQLQPAEEALAVATTCGDHLLATAQTMPQGIAWKSPMSPALRPLCGISHGASGMALALAALGTATGHTRFHHASLGALAYEASVFRPDQSNWPDWREDAASSQPTVDSFMLAWCHGAPGIGLARLAMRGHVAADQLRADVDAAITGTLANGFGRSHSLCHGDLGNLDFLAEASRVHRDRTLAAQVRAGATAVLKSISQNGWRCGVPRGVEAPGLMMGLAGIGYGLLRLAHPELVPSVLTLSGPLPSDGFTTA